MTPETPVIVHRWSPDELLEAPVLETPRASLASFSQPYGEERANEDSLAVIELAPAHHLLLLADGVGGLPGGAQASTLAITALIESIQEALATEQPLLYGIITGFDRANVDICEQAPGSASTLAVVEVADGELRTYHAGDSTVLITGQRGRLKLITIAHSPVGYAQEAGYLTELEAIHHDERHVVSNLLGSNDMRIEIGQRFALSHYDTVVVGSDGLFDNLLSDEIAATIRTGTLADSATALAQFSLKRMYAPEEGRPSKPDDLSFILFRPRGTGEEVEPPDPEDDADEEAPTQEIGLADTLVPHPTADPSAALDESANEPSAATPAAAAGDTSPAPSGDTPIAADAAAATATEGKTPPSATDGSSAAGEDPPPVEAPADVENDSPGQHTAHVVPPVAPTAPPSPASEPALPPEEPDQT